VKKTTKLSLSVVALLAIIAASYALFAQGSNSPSTALPVSTASTSSVAKSQESTASVSSSTGSRKAIPSTDYSTAKNINAYIASLSSASSPPGTLEIAQAKAWDECGSLIARPNSGKLYIADLQANGGKYAEFRIKALQQIDERCKDFAFTTQLKRNDVENLYKNAAKEGNAEAIARNLTNGISTTPADKVQKEVMQVLSANDPAALFTAADAFSDRGPFEMTPGGEVGTTNSKYAWQLAACDQGMDCSASSAVVNQSCIYMGICGPGDYRTNVQYSAVSPANYQEITKAENNINRAIADGNVQSLLNHK